jgi:hypothetical protein
LLRQLPADPSDYSFSTSIDLSHPQAGQSPASSSPCKHDASPKCESTSESPAELYVCNSALQTTLSVMVGLGRRYFRTAERLPCTKLQRSQVAGVAMSLSELVGTTEIVSSVVTVDSRFAIRVSGCRSTKTVLVTTYRKETPLI